MDAHPVRDMDRLLRVVDPNVHVHAEDQLLAGDEAQRRDEVAVAGRATIRWSSQRANGWVPAEPIASFLEAAVAATWLRSKRS